MRISAVVNIYDEEPAFIAEAIDSVRAQSHVVDQIIVVEDGARRDYAALLARYPDIAVIRQPNAGLAAARNTGLAAARGDYVLFLDGDDRLMPDAVATNLAQFDGDPRAVMAYGGWRFIDAAGNPGPRVAMPSIGDDAYVTLLRGNCIGMHATVLYRRTALVAAGGFDAAYRACEDYELYLRLARQGGILAADAILAEYRQHGSNMSSNSVMMRATVQRVLAAQAPFVRGVPDREAACRQGVQNWNVHYARQQYLEMLRAACGQLALGPVARKSVRMFRTIPLTMAKVATMEMIGRLGRLVQRARAAPGGITRTAGSSVMKRLRKMRHPGGVDLGDLRRTTPISPWFGYDRGQPVDRKYIEEFLAKHAGDIKGRVLEIGDNSYTLRFGGERVTLSEVLHVDPDAPGVTYVADLTDGAGVPDATFDCIVLTQTLHIIYDFHAAVSTLHRLLKPGGVLLITVPGVSSVDRGEWGDLWCWSFTPASLRRVLEEKFRPETIDLESHGNVLTATAFLYGLAAHELDPEEFAVSDPRCPVIITARVRKI